MLPRRPGLTRSLLPLCHSPFSSSRFGFAVSLALQVVGELAVVAAEEAEES
jgi:hypothetical protein